MSRAESSLRAPDLKCTRIRYAARAHGLTGGQLPSQPDTLKINILLGSRSPKPVLELFLICGDIPAASRPGEPREQC